MINLIYDTARNAAMNMAIDDVIFSELQDDAFLRIYFWDNPYTTIGYFQKNDCNATRRFTGGLLVNHKDDLSYSFCANSESFPYIYSQQDTYKVLHTAIQKALISLGYKPTFAEIKQPGQINNLCVQTLYSDDLMLDSRKILGSCMRRRGKKILVQGSVHIKFTDEEKEKLAKDFAKNLATILKSEFKEVKLSNLELQQAKETALEKYSNPKWNNKF